MKKKALVTGVFDLLHAGHVDFLESCQEITSNIIVGLETDKRVKAIKGLNRPFYNQAQRKRRLEKVFPDMEIMLLPENFDIELVRKNFLIDNKIQMLIVGQDDPKMLNKKKLIDSIKGELVCFKLNLNVSTTKIIKDPTLSKHLIFQEDTKFL